MWINNNKKIVYSKKAFKLKLYGCNKNLIMWFYKKKKKKKKGNIYAGFRMLSQLNEKQGIAVVQISCILRKYLNQEVWELRKIGERRKIDIGVKTSGL